MQHVDVVILGAGAAGLMCAIEAAKRGKQTLLLDHADQIGKKILISGGGRCNFTNLGTTPENFLSENPHFVKSALARYTPQDFIALVEKHGIPYHEKHLGQLFCDRASRDIVNLLARECAAAQVRIQLQTQIHSVAFTANSFFINTSTGPVQATSLVVATGGLSIPKMGATGLGYDLARQFDHRIVDLRPALVPFLFNNLDASWADLSGVSTEAVATLEPTATTHKLRAKRTSTPVFREKILITHRGLSGPAILQISSYWHPRETITLDLAPGQQIFAPLLAPNAPRNHAAAQTALRTLLPARWTDRFLAHHLPPDPTQRTLPNATILALEAKLHAWRVTPAGTEGYAKAEVTAGGVDTAELDAKTMQSHKVPGLFFIGEVVDVTGWLGGYNFQWAWASGFAAGQAC